MQTSTLIAFTLVTLVTVATPGPTMLLALSNGTRLGMRRSLPGMLGAVLSDFVLVGAVALGLGALLAASEFAFTLLKWAGAVYLLWLGIGMLRSAWQGPVAGRLDAVVDVRPASPAADFRRGLLTNLLNPKVALFMLAFLPQFIPAQSAHKTLAFLGLGLLFIVQSLLFLLGVVLLTARLSRLPVLTRGARGLQVLGGLLFVVLAVRLAGSRLASPG